MNLCFRDIVGIKRLFSLACSFVAGVHVEARNILELSLDAETEIVTVSCSAGEAAVTNVLYYAWSNDGVDKGDTLSSWPNVRRVRLLECDATHVTFNLPEDAAVTSQYAARAFIFETAYDYDYFVEGTKSTGTAASTATCYVDTGFFPTGNKTVTEIDCLMNATKGQQILFGCNDTASLSYGAYINGTASSGGKWAFSCNNGTGKWKMATTLNVSASARVVVTLDGTSTPKGTVTVKSTGLSYSKTYSAEHGNTAARSMTLWCRHNTSEYAGQALATVYSCTITEDGVLLRDFRPAVRYGVAGLWEVVENRFYPSSGTDALEAVGGNLSDSVLDGDSFVSASPAWIQTTPAYVTDSPYIEPLSLAFSQGGSKSGPAPLVLSGKNNWGGAFTNNEGALIADFGQGLALTDALVLKGGTYGILTGSVFDWQTGGGAGKLTVAAGTTSYGFSTYTHPFSVVVNGDADVPLEFGTASSTGFSPAEFVLNDDWATDTLTFRNAIVGRNTDETVSEFAVYTGSATSIVERSVSNVGLVKKGAGTLVLNSSNAVAKIRVENGTVLLATPAASPVVMTNVVSGAMAVKTTGARLHLVDSVLDCFGTLYLYGDGNGTRPEVIVDGSELDLDALAIGAHQKSIGTLVVTNRSVLRVENATTIARGTLKQYGGEVSLFNLKMGTGYTYETAYNVYGGKTVCRMTGQGGFYLGVGTDNSSPESTMNVYEGAAVEVYSSDPSLGRYAGKTSSNYNRGYLNVYGGSFSVIRGDGSRAKFYVGYSGSGGLLVTNGTFSVEGGVIALQENTAGRSAYVKILKNGTVNTDYLRKNPIEGDVRRSVLMIDGGKIVAQKNNNDFISNFLTASVGAEGAVIDTAGFDLGVSQNFSAAAGQNDDPASGGVALNSEKAFVVTGGGKLTLTGTNGWSCATAVSGAVLEVGDKSLPATNLRLDGGVIDLGGYTHTVTNLIGTGIVSNGTLVVVGSTYPGYAHGGSIVIAENAAILTTNLVYRLDAGSKTCGCLDVRGAFDVAGIVVSVENEDRLGSRGAVLIKGQPIAGVPRLAGDGRLSLTATGERVRLLRPGMAIVIR